MGKEKKNFLFMDSWVTLIESMPIQEVGILMKAVCAFVRGNEVKIENPMISAVFTLIKAQIEENTESYKAKCEKQAEYGRKGSTKRWGEKEKAIEGKSYPTENHSYPISENGYPIEKDSYPISEDSYPIAENGYPINCDRHITPL